MEQLRWTTPSKDENKYYNSLMTSSPKLHKTPVKRKETMSKHMTYQNNTSCLNVLPTHITPPSGLTKFIARNPFEPDLTNRLHLSVISPTVFNKVSSPSTCSPNFSWSVEELALIQPAKIEEFPMQQMHCIDPAVEVKAQAAIDQFFKKNQIIPSPWEAKKKENQINIEINTPTRISDNTNFDSSRSKKDGWTQTVLSLPPELPLHVEEILKPYFTFTQEQNGENDDANSSNNSLRRKLFFNHDDGSDNDEDSSINLSPVKMNGSMVRSCSPPQRGMFIHGTPENTGIQDVQRNHITPIVSKHLTPNISPIHSTVNDMSYESVRSRSVIRLDFTMDTSTDYCALRNMECPNNVASELIVGNAEVEKIESKLDESLDFDSNSTCVQLRNSSKTEMPRNSTRSDDHIKNGIIGFSNKDHNVTQTFKLYTNESCIFRQTNALSSISDQISISNSAQDTGYQTHSTCSATNVIDSYSTPVKQKTWGDRILLSEDDFRLPDWKENVKNIFSSTPSRSNREKDNHVL